MTITTATTPTRIDEMVPNTNAAPAIASSADSETSVQKRSSSPGGRSVSTFGSARRRRCAWTAATGGGWWRARFGVTQDVCGS